MLQCLVHYCKREREKKSFQHEIIKEREDEYEKKSFHLSTITFNFEIAKEEEEKKKNPIHMMRSSTCDVG